MALITTQANLFARQTGEDDQFFLRRIDFYAQCTQWMHEFEQSMLAKDIHGGISALSVQFSSSVGRSVAEFRWRNLTYCMLWFDPRTKLITTPFVGIAKLRLETLKQASHLNGVKILSGFLIEVVKNELSKLEKLRDTLGTEVFPLTF